MKDVDALSDILGEVRPLAIFAVLFALFAGCFLWSALERMRARVRHKSAVQESVEQNGCHLISSVRPAYVRGCGIGVIDQKVLEFTETQSVKYSLSRPDPNDRALSFGAKWLEQNGKFAGLGGRIVPGGFSRASIYLAFGASIVFAIIGFMVSLEMGIVFVVLGFALGLRAPKHAIRKRAQCRTQEMERHLPEMLDVMALGARSGLSFDESLKMYTSHFKTMLSEEMSNAQRQWVSGLERRDDALRKVAASYSSNTFKRVIEAMIRSIRFGSSMACSLEAAAAEARGAYRAQREEEVAKAPVKMMVPTGTLILPAMLVMVLGPVLLELAGGGF